MMRKTYVVTTRFGHGVTEHITRVRLDHARQLLRDTDTSIHSIAENTGFADSNYFTHHFKAVFGCTPSACRTGNANHPVGG